MRLTSTYIFILISFFSWSQDLEDNKKLIEKSIDTVFFDTYSGIKSYTLKKMDSTNNLMHGKFTFDKQKGDDDYQFKKLTINGNYDNNLKNGLWLFIERDISMHLGELQIENDKQQASLETFVSGKQTEYAMWYDKGKPHNKWEINSFMIDSSNVKPVVLGEVNFHNGIATGEFFFNDPDNSKIQVKGFLNKEGFLDSEMTITYKKNDTLFKEMREYYDGFLLSIKFFKNEEKIDEIEFENTLEKINLIKSDENVNFEFSKVGFGAYHKSSTKIKEKRNAQVRGNEVINKYVSHLNKFHSINTKSNDTLVFNLTRRFKINYDERNETAIASLTKRNEEVFDSIAGFINSPSVILNKDKSKELTKTYYQTKTYLRKLSVIDTVVTLQKRNFFDYHQREDFIESVLDTIDVDKTTVYIYQGEKDSIQLNLSYALDRKDKIPEERLNILQDSLAKASLINIESTYKEFKLFAQKEKIDSMDLDIYRLNFERDSIFLAGKKTERNFEDRALSTNIFMAYKTNVFNPIYQNYITTEEFEDKVSVGQEIIENNKSILNNKAKVDLFDVFIQQTDSLFTIYRDNPFDYRKSEVKIYPNINRVSKEVLFPYYVNSLLEANKHKEFIKYLNKLKALEERLKYFIEKNNDEIQKIDSAVRRENVPQRIERIYGLQ